MRPSSARKALVLSVTLCWLASRGLGAPTSQGSRDSALQGHTLTSTVVAARHPDYFNSTLHGNNIFHSEKDENVVEVHARGLPPFRPPHAGPGETPPLGGPAGGPPLPHAGPGAPQRGGPPPPPPPPLPPLPAPHAPPAPVISEPEAPRTPAQNPKGGRPPELNPSPPRPEPKPQDNFKGIPDTERPGQGEGKGDHISEEDMPKIETAGKNALEAYENTLKARTPDKPVLSSVEEVDKYGPYEAFLDIRINKAYHLETTDITKAEFTELRIFGTDQLGGINFRYQPLSLTRVGVYNKALWDKGSKGDPIAQVTYDKGGRFVMYEVAFRKNNDLLPAGSRKEPLNEISIQPFLHSVGDKSKNFKAAFFMNIQNKGFWDITRHNYRDRKNYFNEILTFKKGSAGFNRFMGSPNINSKFKSWSNHHNALGSRVPDKIIVAPKQVEGSKNYFDACLVFADA